MSDSKRRIRYQVACSLDGYIAGPDGDYDWITMDPDIDFKALFDQFDTLLMGRVTYEVIRKSGEQYPGMTVIVFSRTLKQEDHPAVTIVADDIRAKIEELRARPGKDIWLFGGGKLFQTLMDLDCVDTIEPAIIPIVLGDGIPMYPRSDSRHPMRLTGQRIYPKSGIVFLEYAVTRRES